MGTIQFWITITLAVKSCRGSECLYGLFTEPYSGTVSVTNNGQTCQAWASQIPHEHSFNDDAWFQADGSVIAARNYCRDILGQGRPWCFTTHPHMTWAYCDFSICTDLYRECGEVLKSETGSITTPDFDGDGLYDLNIDCLWTVQAPKNYVIRYVIQFFEIEERPNFCSADALSVFENGRKERSFYCGSSWTDQMEGETLSNKLYVQFYSDYSEVDRGFNITFRWLEAMNKACGGVLAKRSGWITSPDLDGDGQYDFNLNCTWAIEVDEDSVVDFRILYLEIVPSDDCLKDYLLVYEVDNTFISNCDFSMDGKAQFMTTVSNKLFVRFVSNYIETGAGFRLEYEQGFQNCFEEQKGYNGTVSVTNHGLTCQAWSSQTPHVHVYIQDNYFPQDGSVKEASNYCRELEHIGRPWCYTMDETIIWEYCTFRICNRSTPDCGGRIQNKTGLIISPSAYASPEADCFWTIQAEENYVIKYDLLLENEFDLHQCHTYALIMFEKGGPLHGRTFCGSLYKYFMGETISNIIHIRYYKERNINPVNFYFFFGHVEAKGKSWTGTLWNKSGWIVSPDSDGDNFYDFNVNYVWTIEGNSNSVILLTPVYIIIEHSNDCYNDFIGVADDIGIIHILCGIRNDTTDIVESRLNHLYIEFQTNEIISARGFNFSYEILDPDDDCLTNLLQSDYNGTVSVTNHGLTCQAWASQTPHKHDTESVVLLSFEDYNYCRKIDLRAPWCLTTDPRVRWQYCTYSICNGTAQKCEHVLQNTTGVIVSPDYDNDGLYDLNIDCLWIVEAPQDHVIQFHADFVSIESSINCEKDSLSIFDTKHNGLNLWLCGTPYTVQAGETQTSVLYVQFYSDNSTPGKGFKISYFQIEEFSLPDKACTETLRQSSGWISSPDKDGNGFYDFNLDCVWTVEVNASSLIQFQLLYIDLDRYYFSEDIDLSDSIQIYDDFGILSNVHSVENRVIPGVIKVTRSNVMHVKFKSNSVNYARGFNLTFVEVAKETDCFDELKTTPYSGTVSVTNNGLLCQAWSDQTPHNHSENRDSLFPLDGSASSAKNYCRDIWNDGRPWCYTTDEAVIMGFCTLQICEENLQPCGSVLSNQAGTIVPPNSGYDGFYDLNVDCLWVVVAAENEVIRLKVDTIQIEESSGCRKDALSIFESGDIIRSTYCGFRTKVLEGETASNRLYVHFYSDNMVSFLGFMLTFYKKEGSIISCGGPLTNSSGWLLAPDTDKDGTYDFNQNCVWTIEVQRPTLIKYRVWYVQLVENEDYLNFSGIPHKYNKEFTLHGFQTIDGLSKPPALRRLKIHFFSNNIDASGPGFNISYEHIREKEYNFKLTGDGWIRPPDENKDGLYDDSVFCNWFISAPKNSVIELEILFIQMEGIKPDCIRDVLAVLYSAVFERYCGSFNRQAKVRTYDKFAHVQFHSDHSINDLGFVIAYNQVIDMKQMLMQSINCPGWIASSDVDQNGLYDYNADIVWIIYAEDLSNAILLNVLYIDVEESPACTNDVLQIYYPGVQGRLCGIGFQKIITVLSQWGFVRFRSDYTVNRFGFNMTFFEISGGNYECNVVLTEPSAYLTSIDIDGDGLFDSGQDCLWTVQLGYTNVIVFEVLKQDIPAEEGTCETEFDFLKIYEDHRDIGTYCGEKIATRFTTEANILYAHFKAGQFRSGGGFQAVYFQAEDVPDCSPDYKCLLTDRRIQEDNRCDTYNDCTYGDDERFCQFRCPRGCLCTGLSIDCTGRFECEFNRKPASFLNQTFMLSSATRILDISSNPDMFLHLNLEIQNLVFLTHLNLSSCNITDLPDGIFLTMKRLKVMDLSFNRIRHFKSQIFLNQANLELFRFEGNLELLIIESEAFTGLVALQYLELSYLEIEGISEGSFATLRLKELKIYHSHIIKVDDVSFDKLIVENIYLNSSTIDTLTETMFHGGAGTFLFVTDEYKFCCVRPLSVQAENCYPQKDEFSSCDDLIKNSILKPFIFVIGLFALLTNVVSVIYRLKFHAEQLKFCYGIAVMHLAGSDSLLGIYMIIIGVTDNTFRGTYIFHDESWRHSTWCQIAGVFSTVSYETSVLLSFLITVDRFLVIKFPFGQKRLSRKDGMIIAIAFWSIALFLAILPITLPSLFKGEFYSQSGLCLALPLTRARPSVWGYAFGIFIVFNSFACLVIAVGQWMIYREITSSKKALGDRRSKSTKDSKITRNLLLVVTTNFLCRLPVGFIGVLAVADYPIPVNIYSWVAVVVLPINSAVNPVLYTLSELLQKKKKILQESESKMKYRVTADDLDNCTGLWKSSKIWSFKGQTPGFTSLPEVMGGEWFCRRQRICAAIKICQLLCMLHDWKITQEDLTASDIFTRKASQHRCKMVLVCRPQQMLKVSDQDANMLSLGSVLSTLLREV